MQQIYSECDLTSFTAFRISWQSWLFTLIPEFLVFQYDDDFVLLMPPEDISEEMIYPRFSMLPCYAEKDELEVGMDIRLKWNAKYDRCKARIMGVSANYGEMSDLFDQLDQNGKKR